MPARFGIAGGFAVVLQRYLLLGVLFSGLGVVMVAKACGLAHLPLDREAGRLIEQLVLCMLGGCFLCIGGGILVGGLWWLRRATWLINHTTPVAMLMSNHTRLVHAGDGPGAGEGMLTAFARLIPVDATAGIRQFQRVPLEWPTWRLRWQAYHSEPVRVCYNFVHGGPLVIQTNDGQLLVAQLLWDRTRRHRHTHPPGWLKTPQK